MELIFLGSGGGRMNLIKQIRHTGGFWIESSVASLHVDPGPGALLNAHKMNLDPTTLDAIIVTHNHIDHCSDSAVMIEGMTQYTLKKRGILIGSKKLLEGSEKGISNYHQGRVGEKYIAQFGERKKFKTEKGEFEIEIFSMKHEEETAFGFKLFLEGKVIGHITDTQYLEKFETEFLGCDLLIVNCIKPSEDGYSGHMRTSDVIKILKSARPKKCIITHLGMKMIPVADKEAMKIEKETGIETIAAKDFMRIEL